MKGDNTMTKQRTLTGAQIKNLIKLNVQYKKAKDEYEEAKKILTANLECGKYDCKEGSVIKSETIRMVINMERLAFEHPEINLNDYKEPQVVTSVAVKNFITN